MKIVYLTAGAAGMYCGSCMHDNTLAKAIAKEGIDIELVPTYTPIRTDENDFSVDQVFFGGINVYLQQKLPFLRFLPKIFDRFLDSPSLIKRVTKNASNVSPKELGKLAHSMLKGARGRQKKEVKRLIKWLREKSKPNVILFSNILIGGCIPEIHAKLGIPSFVTLQGDDIFLESLPDPYRSRCIEEIRNLHPFVAGYLTHSHFYADFMSDYFSIPRSQIHVTPLGIEADDFSRKQLALEGQHLTPNNEEPNNEEPNNEEPNNENQSVRVADQTGANTKNRLTIGYLARLAPEKGLDTLVDAFIKLKANGAYDPRVRDAKLRIAGWLGPSNQAFADEQFEKLKDAGLGGDFEYAGSIERASKIEFLQSLDVLCVPTSYKEPKGLFVLEALATGVPVVQPDHGAFPEVIQSTGGGLLYPAGDLDALCDTLNRVLSDDALRTNLGNLGFDAVHTRRNSREMAKLTLDLLRSQPKMTMETKPS